jgi:iron complex transport system substrate-binding protein
MFRAACVLLLLAAVSLVASPQNEIIIDDTGSPFVLSGPPRRIVSLAPNITEILFALDLDDEIVGVTRYCDYPEAAKRKEKIGGLVDPNLEMIKSLSPDLVIAFRGNPLRTVERLKKLGFPVFVLNIGNDLGSLFPLLEKIGRVTHRKKEAAALVSRLNDRLDAVRDRLSAVTVEPRVFLALHGTGLWTCGRESYLNDLIGTCRARNVASAISKNWLHYSLEQLIRDDPEIIIVLARSIPEFEKARDRFLKDVRLRRVAAVRTGMVRFLDENVASRFGPRLADALEETARNIHPDRFDKNP